MFERITGRRHFLQNLFGMMKKLLARLGEHNFLPSLSKTRQPTSRSSAFIEWLTADCDKESSLAARVKLAVRASAANARSCLLSSG
jgi:hypothetical protein